MAASPSAASAAAAPGGEKAPTGGEGGGTTATAGPPSASRSASSVDPGVLLRGLGESRRSLVSELALGLGQGHLFESFGDEAEESREARIRALLEQLAEINESYGGGLGQYLENARRLLRQSRLGANPLDGWVPSVPASGRALELGTPAYRAAEDAGRPLLGSVGFVLVAGGLGERLGYPGIKIGLPTELATGTPYIQYYIEYILAVQSKYRTGAEKAERGLPLCIMTSSDTNDKTRELLEKNNYYGMDPSDVTIVQQGKGVPALLDNDARIAVERDQQGRPVSVVTKPHGHGDVHELLHRHGVARTWLEERRLRYVVLFQDTNGLAFHSLPAMLGVSASQNLIMNSLAVPRKAGQAIGGIATLTHAGSGRKRTINVEYNQLDPLLRSTPGFEDGDANDPATGHSRFPGNINQLVFSLKEYAAVLERTGGVMPEFVNPKYADPVLRAAFKKPTRLECMMQDFPVVLDEEESTRVGFTSVSADLCFSPVKNAAPDGAALQRAGTHPGTASSGEADQYRAARIQMRSAGCDVEEAPPEEYLGVSVVPGPAVVFKPSFCCCPGEVRERFPYPDQVSISARSTLVVRGQGDVTIERLRLDGALVVDCPAGRTLVVNRPEPIVNRGWVRVRCEDGIDGEEADEVVRMRGYRLERLETEIITA